MQDESSRTPGRAAAQVEAAISCSRRALWCEQSKLRCGRGRGAALLMERIGVVSWRGSRMCRSLSRPPVATNGKFVGRFGERRVIKGMDSNIPMPDRGGVWPLRGH